MDDILDEEGVTLEWVDQQLWQCLRLNFNGAALALLRHVEKKPMRGALGWQTVMEEAIGLTGLTLTKLDGTAKGGIVLAIAKRLSLPIRYVGLGEGVEDLEVFEAGAFVDALIGE